MNDPAWHRYPFCFGAALAIEAGAFFGAQHFLGGDAMATAREPEHITVELVEPPKPPEKIPAKLLPPPPPEIPKPVPPEPPKEIPPLPPPLKPEPKLDPDVEKPKPVEPMPVAAPPVPPPVIVAAPVVEKPVEVARVVAPAPALPAVERVVARSNPAYFENPPPPYPEAARRAGNAGVVLLLVRVRADGRVERLEVKESSGNAMLDRAARDAVKRWRFEPAQLGGVAVEDEVEVPIRFSLEQQEKTK